MAVPAVSRTAQQPHVDLLLVLCPESGVEAARAPLVRDEEHAALLAAPELGAGVARRGDGHLVLGQKVLVCVHRTD